MVDLTPQDALNRAPPHVIRNHFLGEAMVKHLLEYVDLHKEQFTANTVGMKERLNQSINVSSSLKKIGNFRDEIVSVISGALPDVFRELGTQPFEPSSFEMLISSYGHGDFYKRHVDSYVGAVSGRSDRVITLVYYFHRLPKVFLGGVLRLHSLAASGRDGSFVDIEPVSDTGVFFPSWFPHEVLPVTCPSSRFIDSRFAITCMIHKHREK
jgi:Rps23 Pro-64 3,4-dihydroxylase Tpa1-like proline 4-hydroxylase